MNSVRTPSRRFAPIVRNTAALLAGGWMLQNSGCSIDTSALTADILTAVFDSLLQIIESFGTAAV